MTDYSVTGVSFGDDALEIIFLDEGEQTEKTGWLHTVYLAYKDSAELRDCYSALQNLLVEMIEHAYRIKANKEQEDSLF